MAEFFGGLTIGPNLWRVVVLHPDGTTTDHGVSRNLMTNAGRDLIAAAMGMAGTKAGALTASTATTATPSGGGLTTNAYKGWRVYAPVTDLTTPPVYGNVGSNTTTVLTVDGWWSSLSDTMSGATPASTAGYTIVPSAFARFMGVSADATTPAAADTTLASEITTGGMTRVKCAYVHTAGTNTYLLTGTWSATAAFTLRKGALFTAANPTAGGVMVFEAPFASATSVAAGDTVTITATITLT
jgi:hypothetical protein